MEEKFKIFTRWIIKNFEWKFLLVEKNSKRKIAPWKVLFPGGTVDFWEKIEETLIREIKEETDLDIKIVKIIDTQTIILGETHWIGIYFLCEAKNLDFRNVEPEKHTRVFLGDLNDIDEFWKEIYLKLNENLK